MIWHIDVKNVLRTGVSLENNESVQGDAVLVWENSLPWKAVDPYLHCLKDQAIISGLTSSSA